jgi:hypothetical protein
MISVITISPLLLALAGAWREKMPALKATRTINSLASEKRIVSILMIPIGLVGGFE